MNRKSAILLFLLSLFMPACFAQSEATIHGVITDAISDSIRLYYDGNFSEIGPTVKTVYATNGRFEFKLKLEKRKLAVIGFRTHRITLFLEPGYDITMSFESDNLPKSIIFEGKGAAENKMCQIFYSQFNETYNEQKMSTEIGNLGIDEFEDKLFEDKNNFFSLYKVYPGRTSISTNLLTFLEAEISYSYYRWLLEFPFQKSGGYGNMPITPLPSTMSEIFDDARFSNDNLLISKTYREFLIVYIRYMTLKANSFSNFSSWTAFVTNQNTQASSLLKGNSYLYWLSQTLLSSGDSIKPEAYTVLLKTLQTKDVKNEYYKTVLSKPVVKKVVPKTAPNSDPSKKTGVLFPFKLEDIDGKEFTIDELIGKIIYVDFWASWCGPCRMQFPYSKTLHDSFSDKERKQITFLYISIDDNPEAWKKAIIQNDLEGKQGRSPGGWSSNVCRFFGINSIPRYILINKEGKIVNDNAPRPSQDEIKNEIRKLLE